MIYFTLKIINLIYIFHICRGISLIDGFNSKMMGEDFCLADSATTHTILKDKKYFQQLSLSKAYVNTISGSSNLIEGSERANIMLPK